MTYTASQFGVNQNILCYGMGAGSTLTLPSCSSTTTEQIITISNSQNLLTLVNRSFIYPLNSPNNNQVDSLIGWKLSDNFNGLKYKGLIIQFSGSYFYPNGAYPNGASNNQSFAWQNYQNNNGDTRSISQNVFLNSGISTLSFYSGPRPNNYDTANTFNITIGSSIVIQNPSFLQGQAWTLFTVNFNASSSGYYLSTINNNGTPNDTTISFANFVLTTPTNTGVLTVNVTNFYPNYNGFNLCNLNQKIYSNYKCISK